MGQDRAAAIPVFTYFMPDHIEEYYAHIGRLTGPESLYYFTYQDRKSLRRSGSKQFSCPYSHFSRTRQAIRLPIVRPFGGL
ncbi:hypothetical protein CHN51_09135 [Sphingorhabdus sp. YGSMI21]|nr:hypothetical protein CHN51_09135 [Sphingorhabdus sp. YGSMI21]